MFDKCFVINLDSRPDRLKEVTDECNKVGIEFTRVSGMVLNEADYPNLPPSNEPHERIRHLGCGLTHRGIIERAKEEKLDSVFVLEDDVTFSDKFKEQLPLILAELKDIEWDTFQFWTRNDKSEKVTGHIKKISGTAGTHCYAVHSRFYDRFLTEYNPPDGNYIIDRYLRLRGGINKYASIGNLAFQRVGYSDIRGCVSDLLSIKRG